MKSWRPCCGTADTNPTRNHEVAGSIPGLRIWCCHELWCKPQTRLGSGVAVALAYAGSYSSDLTPSLGTSLCSGCSPKKAIKEKKKKRKKACIYPDSYLQTYFSLPNYLPISPKGGTVFRALACCGLLFLAKQKLFLFSFTQNSVSEFIFGYIRHQRIEVSATLRGLILPPLPLLRPYIISSNLIAFFGYSLFSL